MVLLEVLVAVVTPRIGPENFAAISYFFQLPAAVVAEIPQTSSMAQYLDVA